MTSPPGAPGPGGRQQQRRPKPKSGRPDGGTTGRRELARHARFAEISPEVGVLDERAMSQALADDPAAFELLAAMTRATDENLRAAAIRLSASIVLVLAAVHLGLNWRWVVNAIQQITGRRRRIPARHET